MAPLAAVLLTCEQRFTAACEAACDAACVAACEAAGAGDEKRRSKAPKLKAQAPAVLWADSRANVQGEPRVCAGAQQHGGSEGAAASAAGHARTGS